MRRLLWIGLCLCGFATIGVYALGLGEISVKSALNEPLRAEIALHDTESTDLADLQVRLATLEEYQQVEMEREPFVKSLKFTVIRNIQHQPVISITTHKAVQSPYLSFLLDIRWAQGQLIRNYTILLDPPNFVKPATALAQAPPQIQPQSAPRPVPTSVLQAPPVKTAQPPPAAQPDIEPIPASELGTLFVDELPKINALDPSTESARAPQQSLTSPPRDSTQAPLPQQAVQHTRQQTAPSVRKVPSHTTQITQPKAAPSQSKSFAGGTYGPTKLTDSLWRIAHHYHDRYAVNTDQAIISIFKANPHAFIGHNINGLKVGVKLRVPSANAMNEFSPGQALAMVQEQTRSWREHASRHHPKPTHPQTAPNHKKPLKPGQVPLINWQHPAVSSVESPLLPSPKSEQSLRAELALVVEALNSAKRANQQLQQQVNQMRGTPQPTTPRPTTQPQPITMPTVSSSKVNVTVLPQARIVEKTDFTKFDQAPPTLLMWGIYIGIALALGLIFMIRKHRGLGTQAAVDTEDVSLFDPDRVEATEAETLGSFKDQPAGEGIVYHVPTDAEEGAAEPAPTIADPITLKIELAKAYIDMGKNPQAIDILNEVVSLGNEAQQTAAKTMINELTR